MSGSLIIQTSFLGDAVLTTPLLAEVARRGPVTLLVAKASAPLFERHPDVRRLIAYDKRGSEAGVAGFARVRELVRTQSRDAVAYLAQGSHRSGALALAAGYRERIGLATSSGRMWYTQRVETAAGAHHSERLWRLAAGSRVPGGDELRPRLFPHAEHLDAADQLLRAHGAAGEMLIALAPGSVWATKRWPFFPELARHLAKMARVVLVGGPGDAEIAREIRQVVGDGAIDATGRLPLLGSAALIARCAALVANDSAPLHLASAMNTPTVAIFGPTVPAFGFGPLAERRAVTQVTDLSCRPCHSHGLMTCPLAHFRCMRDLSPATVLEATRSVLERHA